VEHDAEEIWTHQSAVAVEALRKANLSAKDIAAIGVATRRETSVVWDRKTGVPIGKAIVWPGRRTADVCAALKAAGREPMITQRTGLRLDPLLQRREAGVDARSRPMARERKPKPVICSLAPSTPGLLWKLTSGRGACDGCHQCRPHAARESTRAA